MEEHRPKLPKIYITLFWAMHSTVHPILWYNLSSSAWLSNGNIVPYSVPYKSDKQTKNFTFAFILQNILNDREAVIGIELMKRHSTSPVHAQWWTRKSINKKMWTVWLVFRWCEFWYSCGFPTKFIWYYYW